jgi:hypothetical protein
MEAEMTENKTQTFSKEDARQWARAFEMLLEMDRKANPQLYQKETQNYDDNRGTNNAN